MEQWKTIPGFDRYEVSDAGRVRSLRFGVLRQRLGATSGYPEIGIYDALKSEGGRQRTKLVHRLVLIAFDRPPEDGEACRHLDGNKINNRLENLTWGTYAENWHDTRRHGTETRCAFTNDQVRDIRKRYVAGCGKRIGNARQLADEFRVHPRTITQCANGKTYRWIE